MKITGIIPARYASTRFPGKPLVDVNGKSMIHRVYEQALKSKWLNEILVATDDDRIASHLLSLQIPYVLTNPNHQSGTDRCAEVMSLSNSDACINIQGDEPFINPEQIDEVADLLMKGASIATLVKQIHAKEELFNPNKPKVILNHKHQALYFSRQAIPFFINKPEREWLNHHTFYKHIGIYGYQKETILAVTQLPQSKLELAESLEQLRWIENGYTIQCSITHYESRSIDTPEDLQQINLSGLL